MLFARLRNITFALFTVWLCFASRPAQAQIDLVNNLATSSDGTDRIGNVLWQADSFQTDNRAYTLTAATLKLSSISGGVVTVDLYSNTGVNKPGSPLVTLGTSNPLATTLADIHFTPVGTLVLQPNTVYWVVAHSPTSADWGATASTAFTGAGFIPPSFAFAASSNAGSTWTTQPLANGPNQFRVQGNTPEPGTFAFVTGLGFAGLCALRRRRKA